NNKFYQRITIFHWLSKIRRVKMKIGIDAYYINKPQSSIGIFQYQVLKNIINDHRDVKFYIFSEFPLTDFKRQENVKNFNSNSNIINRNIYIKNIKNIRY
ncbi:MAG: hypothetical protein QXD43_05675, partial [Candidatus Aenigmatarchaeota archaeon]